MIAEASRRAAGLAVPVTFDVGDAHQVEFPDSTFGLCRTERVLRYVGRPEVVLGEMIRVTRAGGSVLAFDWDSDLTVIDAPDSALVRRIAELLDAAVPNPWIGRQLFGLFQRAGLRDVRVVPYAICLPGAPGFASYQQLNRGRSTRPGKPVSSPSARRTDGGRPWSRLQRQGPSSRPALDSSQLAASPSAGEVVRLRTWQIRPWSSSVRGRRDTTYVHTRHQRGAGAQASLVAAQRSFPGSLIWLIDRPGKLPPDPRRGQIWLPPPPAEVTDPADPGWPVASAASASITCRLP